MKVNPLGWLGGLHRHRLRPPAPAPVDTLHCRHCSELADYYRQERRVAVEWDDILWKWAIAVNHVREHAEAELAECREQLREAVNLLKAEGAASPPWLPSAKQAFLLRPKIKGLLEKPDA